MTYWLNLNDRGKMKVVFFHRKKVSGNFSIENLFEQIRNHLPSFIKIGVCEAKWQSQGLINRLRIGVQAMMNQGDINHVTGDIHFATLFLRKKKTILTVHDLGFMHNRSRFGGMLLKWFWIILPIRAAARITVVSEATKKELLTYVKIDSARISVIYNPIANHFTTMPREFNRENPVILQIGTKANKNLARLIRALNGVPCQLVIVGELTKEILGELHQNNIRFSNSIDLSDEEIIERYYSCDIVSFVSTNEGFGLPIIEANAVGRVVVTGNISSMPEIAGDAAEFVDPYDILSIREGFVKVINDGDHRERLIRNGFQNAKRFDIHETVKQYVSIYDSMLNENRK